MKKVLTLVLALVLVLGLFSGCKPASTGGDDVLKVAAIETAYGSEMWQKVCDAFTQQTGIQVQLTTDKNLEDVISGPMQNGEYPDVVHLATGRPAGLTEQMIRREEVQRIQTILHDIAEPYKEVFMWRVFAQLSFRQIGSIFGKSENWACVTYHRARKMILKRLEEMEK